MSTSKLSYKAYKCSHCGFVKQIQTNHYGECYGSKLIGNRCGNCSWKRPDEPIIWECQEKEQ
jgi:DNA-directed RNA polymerase subunit RPC12/RpoP